MNPIITNNIQEIQTLCKNHKVVKLFVFGSVLTENFNKNSDIDFIINFEDNLQPLEKGELWWNLHDKFKDLFKKEIDLINENKIKNPYFLKEIQDKKQLIYG